MAIKTNLEDTIKRQLANFSTSLSYKAMVKQVLSALHAHDVSKKQELQEVCQDFFGTKFDPLEIDATQLDQLAGSQGMIEFETKTRMVSLINKAVKQTKNLNETIDKKIEDIMKVKASIKLKALKAQEVAKQMETLHKDLSNIAQVQKNSHLKEVEDMIRDLDRDNKKTLLKSQGKLILHDYHRRRVQEYLKQLPEILNSPLQEIKKEMFGDLPRIEWVTLLEDEAFTFSVPEGKEYSQGYPVPVKWLKTGTSGRVIIGRSFEEGQEAPFKNTDIVELILEEDYNRSKVIVNLYGECNKFLGKWEPRGHKEVRLRYLDLEDKVIVCFHDSISETKLGLMSRKYFV